MLLIAAGQYKIQLSEVNAISGRVSNEHHYLPVQEIIEEMRAGRMVVLVDEEDRENEGDLVLAADFVTPEAINFMAKYGRGLICLTINAERSALLNLSPMVRANASSFGTNFTASIEAAEGVTTGISPMTAP